MTSALNLAERSDDSATLDTTILKEGLKEGATLESETEDEEVKMNCIGGHPESDMNTTDDDDATFSSENNEEEDEDDGTDRYVLYSLATKRL
jgi:hypothetical protein